MLTLLRQRLIFKMLAENKRQPLKSKAALKRSVVGLFHCLPEPELIAEIKRIGDIRGGMTKLISEAWIELEEDRREEEAVCNYWERVQRERCECGWEGGVNVATQKEAHFSRSLIERNLHGGHTSGVTSRRNSGAKQGSCE